MTNQYKNNKKFVAILSIILAIVWIIFYFSGISLVPFHPDESTQIFMSSDLELIFNNTSELFYKGSSDLTLKETYRLLDAPLTKYMIGISRNLFNQPGLTNDWNWSKTFSENYQSFPNQRLLLISRVAVSIFFPLSAILIFLITNEIFENRKFPSVVALLFFSLNSLLLLHTRRAMAESLLIFFLLLSLYAFLKLKPEKLWLSSIPIAFAINAKQSLLFLIPTGIILSIYQNVGNLRKLLLHLLTFLLMIFGISYILNPIAWKDPIKVSQLMINQRNELSANQISAIDSVTPEFTTIKINEKIIAFIAQSFILEPALLDIVNYEDDLALSFNEYLENPFHKGVLRNLFFGVIFILLSFFGFLFSFLKFSKKKVIVLSISFLLLFVENITFINIPFQRYYLPAIPFVIIFTIFGIDQIQIIIKKRIRSFNNASKKSQ
jgi:4-amino-4-deoxy-L-arabinose transferase-like glycosyltransferase